MLSITLIVGVLIIAGLLSYATVLLCRLKRQRQAEQAQLEAIKQKKLALIADINTIAQAMVEGRCELSEGVLRIGKLFDLISLTDNVMPLYPDFFAHYDCIKNHPILEQRAQLPKQERMKLDAIRIKSETKLAQGVICDAEKLTQYSLS